MIARNKPVPIDCLDKPRSLLFGLNALSEIKQAVGNDVLTWSQADWQSLFLDALRGEIKRFVATLAALLRHEDKSVTAESVGDMVASVEQVEEISRAMMRAWAHFNGKSDEEFDRLIGQPPVPEEAGEVEPDPTNTAPTLIDSGRQLATISG